jgi:membrane-associated protein
VEALIDWLNVYGYPVLFAVVFAENTGLPVPGETAVLLSGLVAGRPETGLSIVWVIVVTVAAAVLGDNLGFWLGRRWARARLEQGKRFLFLTPKSLQVVEGYFEHYGTLTVFFARFVAGLRVVAALAAGTSRLTWPRFLVANAAGAVTWATTMALLGYFFGQSWEMLHRVLHRGGLIILGCVLVLFGVPFLWRRVRRMPVGTWNQLLRSQIWQGIVGAFLVVVCMAVLLLQARPHPHPPPSDPDRRVTEFVAGQHIPLLDAIAVAGSYLGSLPMVTSLALLMVAHLWYRGRPGREVVAVVWALAASELLGLLLLWLIRKEGIEPARALAWPFGFAGLAPLRGASIYGMLAHILVREHPARARLAAAIAVPLILLIGFSVVWTREQLLTEVLVEYAAGSVLLFAGLWWLEGYGVGRQVGPADQAGPATGPGLARQAGPT